MWFGIRKLPFSEWSKEANWLKIINYILNVKNKIPEAAFFIVYYDKTYILNQFIYLFEGRMLESLMFNNKKTKLWS